MSHTYASLHYHMVFSTKNREPRIDDDFKEKLHPYLGGIARGMNGKALEIGGVADHVHLLVGLPAVLAVAEAIRVLKANSSRWVHETCRRQMTFGWQTGYAAFTVSQSAIPAVIEYIRNQAEHHRTLTFQEEFILLLKKHGIAYDERYLWD